MPSNRRNWLKGSGLALLARRLVESGVRVVEITHGNWDQHFNLQQTLGRNCESVDLPIAGPTEVVMCFGRPTASCR